jgi:hypothetical protein
VLPLGAAGWGLRASLRRSLRLPGAALLLAAALVACGGPEGSSQPSSAAPGGPDVTTDSGSGDVSASVPAEARGLERVGDLDMQVASYDVPDVLEGEGGAQLSAMLAALGLEPADVGLVIAVDPAGSLAIGRWELPGANAEAILSAWDEASGGDWQSESLAGAPALYGRGPDGGRAWATARDGVFLYIATDEPSLAEAAAEAAG